MGYYKDIAITIDELARSGMTPEQIADIVGVSVGEVVQVLTDMAEQYEA